MKKKFLDSEAKRLFAMPTYNEAKKKVDNDFDALMTQEEHEAESNLREELYSHFAEYLESKGIYNEKRHEIPIISALCNRKAYHIFTEMMYSEPCGQCPHLKARYESLLNGYKDTLERLGILIESEVPNTTKKN